jgi:hypothetical protein
MRQSGQKKVVWIAISYSLVNSLCNSLPFALRYLLSVKVAHSYEYPILVAFTISEYLLLAYLFILLIKNKVFHKLIYGLSIIFIIVVAINYSTGKNQIVDSLPIGMETIFILIFSFYYLYEQMNIVEDSFIYGRYQFWLVIGAMIYLSGSFFIYIFANQIYANQSHVEIIDDYWFLTYVLYILKNVFFLIGLNMLGKNSKILGNQLNNKFTPYLN